MGRVCSFILILLTIGTGFIIVKVKNFYALPEVPKLESQWWGPGKEKKEDTSIQHYKINVPDEVLKDLQYRLQHTRPFTAPLEGTQHQYGFNTDLLQDILKYWKSEYKWKEREAYLNKLPQFTTTVQGLKIHYIHAKPTKVPEGVKVLPLLLLHGWPGSLREFYEFIPILTTPRVNIVFEVIAPHLPGFGFSQAASKPGLGAAQIAVVFKNLMNRLGHEKYYTQGGDFGSIILQTMAVMFSDNVLGFHSNMCTLTSPLAYAKIILGSLKPDWIVKHEHEDRVYPVSRLFSKTLEQTGYLHIQATKPDTIGVALGESPIGLAAYILEKFIAGTDASYIERRDGGLTEKYTYDTLLDDVMIYWVSGSVTSTFRLYAETFNKAHHGLQVLRMPITIPTACSRFSNDFYSPDGVLGEVYKNLVHLTDYQGGHFAAFENPEILADDVYEAIGKMENIRNTVK